MITGKLIGRQMRRNLGIADFADLEAIAGLAGSCGDPRAGRVLAALPAFIAAVAASYEQFTRDLELRSRSLALSSAELNEANERLRAEARRQARDSEHALRSMIDAMPLMVAVLDIDLRYEYANRRYEELFGVAAGGLAGRQAATVMPLGIFAHVEPEYRQVLAGSSRAFDCTMPTPDGTARHLFAHHVPRLGVDGSVTGVFSVVMDIGDRVAAEQALRASEAKARQLALVARRTSNAVMITDANGRIEWVNDGFSRLTGYDAEEVVGATPDALLVAEHTDTDTLRQIRQAVREGRAVRAEILHRDRSGREHWVETDIEPVAGETGAVERFVILETDITGRKEAERLLREAARSAQAANRAKSEFVANMSHEIRTPMNGVLGMTELLLDTSLSDEQRRYAGNIRSSADALLNIINDILDFSKIEAGRMELDPVEFDVRELVEEVAELTAARAQAKGLDLLCRIDAAVPARVRGDAGRLRQVLTNLVGNAVKFTQRGEVVVELAPRQAGRMGFGIRDTGIGITADARERLFTPFMQADGSMTRRFGGTGLGLAISRQLVRLMGGDIEVESTPGAGSCFSFDLAMDAVADDGGQQTARRDLSGLGVLIVEDNLTNAEILSHYAAGWGMRVACVRDAAAAEARLADPRHGFDVALIDWKLPVMSGIELAARMRARAGAPRMVLLTSLTASNVAQAAREAGFAAHLSKPLRREELRRAIARVMGVETGGAKGVVAPLAARQPSSGRRVLLVEDNPVNRDIGEAMLASLGHEVDVAHNGIEAVAQVGQVRYDLVLMDCQMPEMDGFTATAEIRMREEADGAPRLPIVALTANAMQGDRERCLAAGMDDYLAKPFTRSQMAAVLVRWLGDDTRAGALQGRQAAGATVSTGLIDPQALANIRALERPGSSGLLERVIECYVVDGRALYERIRDAAAKGDAAGLAGAAHTLKSASANIGARGAAECSRTLETAARAGDLRNVAAAIEELRRQLDGAVAALRAEFGVAA